MPDAPDFAPKDKKPSVFSRMSESTKRLVILAWVIAIVLIPVFYFTISGKATVVSSVEDLQQQLAATEDERDRCYRNLAGCEVDVTSYQTDIGNLRIELDQAKSKLAETQSLLSVTQNRLSTVEQELSQIQFNISFYEAQVTEANQKFRLVVVNSARQVCCTPGTEIAGFSVVDNKIICRGDYNVNCATGESNF